MQLKDNKHLVIAPIGWGHYNAFSLPDLILRLNEQYEGWVRENASELVEMLRDATSAHLMCGTDDVNPESVELQYQVTYDNEQWIAHLDRDGVKLIYTDGDWDNWVALGDLESESYLLGQIIGDPVVQNLLKS